MANSKKSRLKLTTFLFLAIVFITLWLIWHAKSSLFFYPSEKVNIKIIDDDSLDGFNNSRIIQEDIKDVFQSELNSDLNSNIVNSSNDSVDQKQIIADLKAELLNEIKKLNIDSNSSSFNDQSTIIALQDSISSLNERLDLIEQKLSEFNDVVVNIPNYQQLIMAVVNLETAIKKGHEYSQLILKIKNLSEDIYIISRINKLSETSFLEVYGEDNIIKLFKDSMIAFDNNSLVTQEKTGFYEFFGDFIVVRRTANYSASSDELITEANLMLSEGRLQKTLESLRLLDEKNYIFFESFDKNANNYLEALRLCNEIKSYLNL